MKLEKLSRFLDTLGLDEPPMGLFYTDTKPKKGFSPGPATLPTREREERNEIDWQQVFTGFACVMGKIWLARKKQAHGRATLSG
jgi:hypothetical protein